MTGAPSGLGPDQAKATHPRAHAALSASAGTGKTHVLTSKVFRLLLDGAAPESILCLTFTKAGAANMAERLGQKLARWVRMEHYALAKELQDDLGESGSRQQVEIARTLFARVLDAPGGIRVQTIHAFAQSLLSAFPAEAGISPGFRQIEGRAQQELRHRTLADLLVDAERDGDRALIADIERLSRRLGEKSAVKYLSICADHAEAMGRIDAASAEAQLRRLFGVPDGDIDALLAERCNDPAVDCGRLRSIAEENRLWSTKKGSQVADDIEEWLGLEPSQRAQRIDLLRFAFVTKTAGTLKSQRPKRDDYDTDAEAFASAAADVLNFQLGVRAAADMAAGLRAGRAYALAYRRAKRAQGVADFDDLIAWTRDLLGTEGIGDWVRFKLDQRIDHVLIDEAQDTNADQWAIIDSLTDDFFSGASEAEARFRTLLIVGDFKQAIFRFQGTDPDEFEKARQRYRSAAEALIAAEDSSPSLERRALPFHDLGMNRSFRSAQGILDVVDATIAELGWDSLGLPAEPLPHLAAKRHLAGTVELWAPFAPAGEEEEEPGNPNDAGEEGWIDLRERRYAQALAGEVKALIDSKLVLGSTGKPVRPGDILILVRSRRSLSALIVARLFAAGVPVGGVDRLELHAPIAVQDLVAAMRFAIQPLDDLNLACLLVSPLIGWTQERLMAVAAGRDDERLWPRLRARADCASEAETLTAMLNMADFVTPASFLETVLSGPMQGRKRLYARLTMAARDPIDELLNAALAFEREEVVSLEHFLAWFARGEVEIARDADQQSDEVRVMTVHGAKGLEAPVVIIADAHSNPDDMGVSDDPIMAELDGVEVPLSRSGSKELPGALAELLTVNKAADLREHMRLLYVAMTRAIDRLVIAGLEPKRGIKVNSWHNRVTAGLERAGAVVVQGAVPWGSALRFERPGEGRAKPAKGEQPAPDAATAVPDWANRQAPQEARPPRPLAPSAMAKDDVASPPPGPALRAAAERGTWIHSLLERLVDVAPDQRTAAALSWLGRNAGLAAEQERLDIAREVCAILSDPDFAALLGPGSLGEAPLAATLPDGRVIAGTVDRLLVEPDQVSVIDFKTGRVPVAEAAIPAAHRAQMTAYAEALTVIFPGRRIRSALLYTAGPKLFDLGS